jgi:Zn-dependent protease with chaperone function
MSTAIFLYPANPANVPPAITQPSPAFKKEVSGVMGSILLFFFVYLVLFILSIALAAACLYGGFAIITNVGNILVMIAGVGVMGLGVMVFVFLVKFLFAVSRYDRSGIIEVKEDEQPQLFAFIRQLTKDTQTPFPKKVFLSADVNASVFYDSGFWSMFLPVKKNLQIGLGLVNTLNISEFKAVMAHEFGHFSQRSMKLGSFVYNVNKIIHNMLYENTSYAGFLNNWASIGDIFAFFANVTAKIAQGIQAILRKMYGVVNKSYMRLSREMEFHADAVAASVSGSQSLVTALRRLELANSGYTIALQKCDDLYREKKISSNIYRNQTSVLLQLASEFKLPIQHGLPVVSDEFLRNNNLARVNFKDQWASHPTTEDREKSLNDLAVPAETMHESAWVLFSNREQLQEQLTQKVYEQVEKGKDIITINEKDFEEKLHHDIRRFSFPDMYNGFYDGRQVAIADIEKIGMEENLPDLQELFGPDNVALPKKINAVANDIEIVKAIGDKRIQTKTFDFDGVKYKRSEVGKVIAQLEAEQKSKQDQLELTDRQAMDWFYRHALKQYGTAKAQELKALYAEYFELRKNADAFNEVIVETMQRLAPLYMGSVPVDHVTAMIADLKRDHEPQLRTHLKKWLEIGAFSKDPELWTHIKKFINHERTYFNGTTFFDSEWQDFNRACNEGWNAVSNYLFEKFKTILEMQAEMVSKRIR